MLSEAAEHGSAYIYLVAAYGRSGTVGPPDPSTLIPVLETLRAQTDVPVAVGFGVKDKSHIDGLGAVGADAAIVGSTCVARVTDARAPGATSSKTSAGYWSNSAKSRNRCKRQVKSTARGIHDHS